MRFLNFKCPSFPYFLVAGNADYSTGVCHPTRKNVGDFDLVFVTKGKLFLQEEDIKYVIHENEYLLLSPDTRHIGYKGCEEHTFFYWLHFNTDEEYYVSDTPLRVQSADSLQLSSFVVKLESSVSIPVYKKLDEYESSEINRIFRELYTMTVKIDEDVVVKTTHSTYKRPAQQSIFIDLLDILDVNIQPSESNDPLSIAIRYIENNFQKDITIKSLADQIGFHPNYLTRIFKKRFGITPINYLISHRIAYAKHLLAHTNFTINRICTESGFNSSSYFTIQFKKFTGTTPKKFREHDGAIGSDEDGFTPLQPIV